MRRAAAALAFLAAGCVCSPRRAALPVALPPGYAAHEVSRPDGSALRFYTYASTGAAPRSDVALYLDGSGCNGQFYLRDGELTGAMWTLFARAAPPGVLVAAPEKRGLPFGHDGGGGSGEGCPEEYNRHASWESRVSDAALVVRALRPRGRVLAVGHSEGAHVSAALAGRRREVSHVAVLAAGGTTQMFDRVLDLRRRARAEGWTPEETEKAVTELEDELGRILAAPEEVARSFQGHAYKRWHGYVAHPPVEGLLRSRARVFLAHGSADPNVPVEAFDFMALELIRRGRTGVSVRRYPGRGHGFEEPGTRGRAGLESAFRDLFQWFMLESPRIFEDPIRRSE